MQSRLGGSILAGVSGQAEMGWALGQYMAGKCCPAPADGQQPGWTQLSDLATVPGCEPRASKAWDSHVSPSPCPRRQWCWRAGARTVPSASGTC